MAREQFFGLSLCHPSVRDVEVMVKVLALGLSVKAQAFFLGEAASGAGSAFLLLLLEAV